MALGGVVAVAGFYKQLNVKLQDLMEKRRIVLTVKGSIRSGTTVGFAG